MIKNLSYIKKLHKRVIHGYEDAPSLKAVYAEDRYIKRIDYNELNLVCKDCFSDPD